LIVRDGLVDAKNFGRELASVGNWRVTQFHDSGDVINHAFYRYGIPAYALELGQGFVPLHEDRDDVFENHLAPFMRALQQAATEA
jgi:hypothetical protein